MEVALRNLIMNKVQLVCPKCRGMLVSTEFRVQCQDCGGEWSQKGATPSFIEQESYWGEITQEMMWEIIEKAEQEGWRNSVSEYLYPHNPKLYRYVTDETRADFRFLLPLSRKSVVLDIGSGWGLISTALARVCGLVVSLESVYERIRFSEIRMDQEGLNNIQLVQSDFSNLPFPESTFDFIIMNGVMEWFGILEANVSPKKVQEKVLRNISRLLKKGGVIYIGIENRYGFRQILGARDHSGLRFTSLMPRRIANIYLSLRMRNRFYRVAANDKPSYRTYTYSLKGYTKLLRDCGFNSLEVFYPFPSYNNPTYLIPHSNNYSFAYFVENLLFPRTMLGRSLKKVAKLFRGLNPQQYFASDFCLLARKKEP